MEAPELEARLMALEQAREAEMQEAAMQAFMNKYGSRMSNNRGIGNVVLNELQRRGISTDAVTNEAVDKILDEIRMEAQAVLDTIQVQQQQLDQLRNQANQEMDKIDAVKEAITTAATVTGGPEGATLQENLANTQNQMDTLMQQQAMDMPPADAGAGMPPVDMGAGAPPADAGAGVPPAEPPAEPPADAGAGMPPAEPPAEPLPPEAQVSDKKKKVIHRPYFKQGSDTVSDKNMKNVQTPASTGTGNISLGIISACRGI